MEFFSSYISPLAPQAVAATLNTGRLSAGSRAAEFEALLANQFGLAHPVSVNSGTSALVLALLACGIGAGDTVIVPSQTFVATALAVLQTGAGVFFCDIDPRTGNMNGDTLQAALRACPQAKAVICVHWGGYPCDLRDLDSVLVRHGDDLYLIEDAAQALGATYYDFSVGACHYSDLAAFSFQATKHLTTGDGGAVSSEFGFETALRNLRWFGIDREHAQPDELGERQYQLSAEPPGGKYHLNDYAATLGIANAEGFEARMAHRRLLAARYDDSLGRTHGITLPAYQPTSRSAYWLYPILLADAATRLALVRKLKAHGIPSSVVHQRIDKHPLFGQTHTMGNRPGQTEFDARQLNLPLHDAISLADVDFICDVIGSGW